jgi:hypothetical protein
MGHKGFPFYGCRRTIDFLTTGLANPVNKEAAPNANVHPSLWDFTGGAVAISAAGSRLVRYARPYLGAALAPLPC